MVKEVRLGFNRIHITFSPNNKTNPVSLGIQDGNNFAAGLPQISIQTGGFGLNFGGPSGFPQGRGDTTGVLADTLSWVHGRHSFKFGGEFRRFFNNNFNSDTGTLQFLNLTQFINGTPNTFAITPGNLPSRIQTGELGFFGQDSWKISARLTLELGLRYDWNQTPSEAFNRLANFAITTPATATTKGVGNLVTTPSPYQQNNKNFQPRLGFAWDVFGSGKTVLRSGYAVLTDQPITNLVTGLTANPPFGNPKSFVGGNTTTTTYATLLTANSSTLSPTVVDPKFKNAYGEYYNLNIEQQLRSKWSVMGGYFGSMGRHLRTRVNLNQFLVDAQGHVIIDPITHNPARPYPSSNGTTLGNISDNVSTGNSRYDALWITSNLSQWRGLQFNASYTFSKSLDYTSQNGQGVVVQNSLNPAGDRGLSDYNATHRFSTNVIYVLPFPGNRFIQGWQLGTIVQLQTGNPVNLFASGLSGLTGLATLRPDQIGSIQIVNQVITNGPQPVNIQWFSPSAFSTSTAPGTLHFGNLGRNVIIGPGFENIDFSLVKKTKITERFSNELRLDAFDIFNDPNFGHPARNSLGGSSFGV